MNFQSHRDKKTHMYAFVLITEQIKRYRGDSNIMFTEEFWENYLSYGHMTFDPYQDRTQKSRSKYEKFHFYQ